MFAHEPEKTALLLVTLGVLLGVSVLFSRAAGRIGMPVALALLGVGMVAGEEGLGIPFGDYGLTFRLGTVALALILFDAGLNTPLAAVRDVLRPGLSLSTFGVLLTAGFVTLFAIWLGVDRGLALLLGAVVSSTDSAAVFGVLRGSGLHLHRRVSHTLELESGLNDPLAVILTLSVTQVLVKGGGFGAHLVLEALQQMVVGAGMGVGLGFGARALLRRVHLTAAGLYPVLTLAIALLAFGLPTLLGGSGFLGVYVAAILLGSERIRYRSGVLRVHDALGWLSQTGMFLLLGLVVTPSKLLPLALTGTAIALGMAFVGRPLAVLLSLWPFRYRRVELVYVSWVGLRGAVPLILATFPILAGAPGADTVFHLVFTVVIVNALVPGMTVGWVTRKLGLVSKTPPAPEAVLEISSTTMLEGELISFFVREASAVCGATLADLPFPDTAVATLILRGRELVAPKGGTALQAGDHVYVFCKPSDVDLLRLLFGQEEQGDG